MSNTSPTKPCPAVGTPEARAAELTMQEAFEAAFAAKDEMSERIIPALVTAMGKEGAADLLRDMADELDGG